MRKFLASIAALSLTAAVSAPMTAMAASGKTSQATTVVEHATLTPIGKNHVHGTATLTLDKKSHVLTVVLTASGLTPKTVHADHIHVDGLSYNKYILHNLVANSAGDATETTVFHNVTQLGKNPWVIITHGPNLKNPVNASVIAQGALK